MPPCCWNFVAGISFLKEINPLTYANGFHGEKRQPMKKNKKEKRKTDTSTHEFQNFFWTKTENKLDSEDEHIYWKEGHFLELSFPYVQ